MERADIQDVKVRGWLNPALEGRALGKPG